MFDGARDRCIVLVNFLVNGDALLAFGQDEQKQQTAGGTFGMQIDVAGQRGPDGITVHNRSGIFGQSIKPIDGDPEYRDEEQQDHAITGE